MKKIKTIIFLFLVANILHATELYSVKIDGVKKTTFNTISLNKTDYIDLQLICSGFFPGSKVNYNKFEIKADDLSITFSPSSMFLLVNMNAEKKVFQMRKPAIFFQKRLLVPLNSLLLSLEVLGLYKVESDGSNISLLKFKSASPTDDLFNNFNSVTLNNTPKSDEKIKNKSQETIIDDKIETTITELDNIISKDKHKKHESEITNEGLAIELPEIHNGDEKTEPNEVHKLGAEEIVTQEDINILDEVIKSISDSIDEQKNNIQSNEIILPNSQIKEHTIITKDDIVKVDLLKENTENHKEITTDNANKELKNDLKMATKFEPNAYNLPPNLDRGDLSQDYSKPLLADASNNNLALANIEKDSKLQIVKGFAEKKNDLLEIHLYSNLVIENYQKPDCDGKVMKIRIPGATNKISDFTSISTVAPIKKISSEMVRDILIYTIHFSSKVSQCNCKRNGPKELIFSVNVSGMKETTESAKNEEVIEKKDTEETKPQVTNFEHHKKKWELDVIVLDPGHGGHDAGAVGVTGVFEKDITLKLARKVKEILAEKMPDTKVVLTRDDDRFIELFKRGQIANQVGGKLFISIHLNSANKKPSPARGVETYILRPGRNDDAIRVANFENSVIKFEKQQDMYKHLNEEQIIIATMAQSAFVQFSEKFAKLVQTEVLRTSKLDDRGVKQAGFYVLVGASMPNVLFEACFLSNPDDEKFANSNEGQEKIAQGLVTAIKRYSEEYMK